MMKTFGVFLWKVIWRRRGWMRAEWPAKVVYNYKLTNEMCRSNVGTYLYQPVLWHCLWTRMADAKEWKISEEWHHTCEPDLQIFLIHARLSLKRYLGQNSFLKDWSCLWFSAFWSAGGACAFSMNRDVFRWWGVEWSTPRARSTGNFLGRCGDHSENTECWRTWKLTTSNSTVFICALPMVYISYKIIVVVHLANRIYKELSSNLCTAKLH